MAAVILCGQHMNSKCRWIVWMSNYSFVSGRGERRF